MKNKKINTGTGVIIIVIIAIMVGMFVWKYENNEPLQADQQTSRQNNNSTKFEISDNWTLVSNYNFWRNPSVFKRHPYNFPNIEFSYPENWEFRCCGDMDHASEHFINPPSRDKSLPYIRITDYVLNGCPDLKNDCAIDETVKLTANEKFNRLKSNVPSGMVLKESELEKLNTKAFVYKKTEKDGGFSIAYLINLKDDIIQVDFVNHELLDEKFIENFLNRIEFEN